MQTMLMEQFFKENKANNTWRWVSDLISKHKLKDYSPMRKYVDGDHDTLIVPSGSGDWFVGLNMPDGVYASVCDGMVMKEGMIIGMMQSDGSTVLKGGAGTGQYAVSDGYSYYFNPTNGQPQRTTSKKPKPSISGDR